MTDLGTWALVCASLSLAAWSTSPILRYVLSLRLIWLHVRFSAGGEGQVEGWSAWVSTGYQTINRAEKWGRGCACR